MMGYYRYRTGTGTAGGSCNKEKTICFVKPLGCPESIDNLVCVFSGDFGTKLINLADAMTAGLTPANEYAVLVI